MKKEIILTLSALTLAVVGLLGHTRANKSPSPAIYTKSGVFCFPLIIGYSLWGFTSNNGGGAHWQAEIRTIGGLTRTLWSTSSCNLNKVYWRD
jgi:hypothetical protein